MNKPWKVILVFLGVFVAGGLCGAALGIRFFHGPPPGARGPVRLDIMERLDKGLKLTSEQKEKIKPIVQRTQEETQRLRRENVRELAAVMDRMHTEVAAELTPEQRTKLEDMRKRFRERAERVRGFFHDRQPPPPPPPDDKTT
jgi:Spy/CpxP family protein refolding chaperone